MGSLGTEDCIEVYKSALHAHSERLEKVYSHAQERVTSRTRGDVPL